MTVVSKIYQEPYSAPIPLVTLYHVQYQFPDTVAAWSGFNYYEQYFTQTPTILHIHFWTHSSIRIKGYWPHPQDYLHRPPDYKHTDILCSKLEGNCPLLHKQVTPERHPNRQTDRLPNALFPCFAVANKWPSDEPLSQMAISSHTSQWRRIINHVN